MLDLNIIDKYYLKRSKNDLFCLHQNDPFLWNKSKNYIFNIKMNALGL